MKSFCTFLLLTWISLVLPHPHEDVNNVQTLTSENPVAQLDMVHHDEQMNDNKNSSNSVRAKRYGRYGLWQTTTRGTSCDGSCKRLGTDYYWCRTKRWSGETSWDYCSPYEGIDYYGYPCKQECAFQGYSYKWCYVTTGTGTESWGYCSSQSLLPSSIL